MFQSNNQIVLHAKALASQDSSSLKHVGQNNSSMFGSDENNEMQNREICKAQSVFDNSKKLQDDLQMLGRSIKQHEDNIKSIKNQKNRLDDSILDMQVALGKFHSSNLPMTENEDLSHIKSEDETVEHILQHEKSAAGILCQLKTRHGTQAFNIPLTKDVLGIVATLGKVDDDSLSRRLSEYLGMETMMAVVCKTYDGVKALETYEKDGSIVTGSGLHGLGASIGRPLSGRFLVICLEHLRPYVGEFIANDPQRRLDLLKPKLQNGESPPGFLGFAVNMISVDSMNLYCLTTTGHGLRETLFYSLFSRLQVYRTRADMLEALPLISDGALSLDGGIIRSTGVFSLGNKDYVETLCRKC
ncbi:unnamed protein product [Ilex paraguariensis]|uniref:Protein DEFECTIVE IN MERISTEM SILENCING 3 n=1 Tax=Ilex paraguariensis TaxID=185542 RepID=A0ABC8RNJ0_9AQUA